MMFRLFKTMMVIACFASLPSVIFAADTTQPIPSSRPVDRSAIGNPLPLRPMKVRNGKLQYDDGSDVALWGVNYQASLSWEFENTLRRSGVNLDSKSLCRVIDEDLPQLALMHVSVIRVHLLPADFTDDKGDLVATPYLDALDYLISQCDQRGIYVYVTLVNGMGKWYLPQSFLSRFKRTQWTVDDDCIALTRHYIHAILTHQNQFTHRTLAAEPSVALIELLNEPDYPDHAQTLTDQRFAGFKQRYLASLAATGAADDQAHFFQFRRETVGHYLHDMIGEVRAAGAAQPIVWNLNWPRFIRDHGDVFQAVAQSDIDAISFCCYPGQSDVQKPYWEHPTDLSAKNYTPNLQSLYDDPLQLRYLLDERFATKAKLVYEFEEFYNQSGYVYPEMARLFRGLGAQVATMWRYVPRVAVTHLDPAGCSHNLNLISTPGKSVSFVIASDVFQSTPLYEPYQTDASGDDIVGPFEMSFPKNMSLESAEDRLVYSKGFDSSPIPIHADVKDIVGVGSTPLVSYDGSGSYFIHVSDKQITVRIDPDVIVGKPPFVGLIDGKAVCAIDEKASHRFELHVPAWTNGGPYSVWQTGPDGRRLIARGTGTPAADLTAGEYSIERP